MCIYMIREPIYRQLNVCRYIACFLWATLHSVGLGYVVTGILYRGLCPDALNDPNDPGLCELTEVALKGFLAEQKLEQKSCERKQEHLQDFENDKKAAKIICDYVDSTNLESRTAL